MTIRFPGIQIYVGRKRGQPITYDHLVDAETRAFAAEERLVEEREQWWGLRRVVELAIEKMRGDLRNQEPRAVADVLERALPKWGCARDSDWCDGHVCREQGVECPNQIEEGGNA
jgi:hypothetical protein